MKINLSDRLLSSLYVSKGIGFAWRRGLRPRADVAIVARTGGKSSQGRVIRVQTDVSKATDIQRA